jgi:hypothetical protein
MSLLEKTTTVKNLNIHPYLKRFGWVIRAKSQVYDITLISKSLSRVSHSYLLHRFVLNITCIGGVKCFENCDMEIGGYCHSLISVTKIYLKLDDCVTMRNRSVLRAVVTMATWGTQCGRLVITEEVLKCITESHRKKMSQGEQS